MRLFCFAGTRFDFGADVRFEGARRANKDSHTHTTQYIATQRHTNPIPIGGRSIRTVFIRGLNCSLVFALTRIHAPLIHLISPSPLPPRHHLLWQRPFICHQIHFLALLFLSLHHTFMVTTFSISPLPPQHTHTHTFRFTPMYSCILRSFFYFPDLTFA